MRSPKLQHRANCGYSGYYMHIHVCEDVMTTKAKYIISSVKGKSPHDKTKKALDILLMPESETTQRGF